MVEQNAKPIVGVSVAHDSITLFLAPAPKGDEWKYVEQLSDSLAGFRSHVPMTTGENEIGIEHGGTWSVDKVIFKRRTTRPFFDEESFVAMHDCFGKYMTDTAVEQLKSGYAVISHAHQAPQPRLLNATAEQRQVIPTGPIINL